MKKYSSATVWIIAIILLFFAASFLLNGESSSDRIVFSEFQQKWINDEIESVRVDPDKMLVTGQTKDKTNFTVYAPDSMIEMLNSQYAKNDIKIEYVAPSNNSAWLTIIPMGMIILLFVVFIFFFTQQSQGSGSGKGVMTFGKSRAKMLSPDAKKVTFDDVAGADEEKAELEEIVDFLKSPSRYIEMGARIPKGVLLVGPPGTGKTLLAKAIAGEAGVPFFSISGSDFVEMFVGVGASRVRDLFEQAKKNSPALIFIDEIDAVGRQRGAGLGGGHDEREQTLNQLLVEMDGFGTNSGIIVIAATNRPDVLDPALLRPGRFDRQITVNRPDAQGREDILKVHSRNKPLGPDVDLKEIAKDTIGFTGADLENLLNEAALLAVRRKKKALTMQEISDATSRVEMGTEKKSHKYSEKAKKLTAYHEAGHAVSSYYIEGHDPVKEISIIPRGMGAGGYTWYTPQEENYNSKADMLDDLISLLGGRVAEALSLNDISTGASNDLQRATSICRDMVSKYGMSDELGPVVYSDDNNEVFLGKDYGHVNNYSEATSARIDEQIEKMMRKAYSQTESILKTHYDKLELVAETLIKNEKISGDQFTQLMENGFIADEKVSENEDVQVEDTEIVDVENVNEDDLSSNDTKD